MWITLDAVAALAGTAIRADAAINQMPLIGALKCRLHGVVLDTIFGPYEDFEYVSTTTPGPPPPR